MMANLDRSLANNVKAMGNICIFCIIKSARVSYIILIKLYFISIISGFDETWSETNFEYSELCLNWQQDLNFILNLETFS